uniref:Uncharacterized protein n=1 Tax=Mesoaciditoga lauensis TaxID=1495039 RepID=A0A7V3VT59_9BACT
MKKILLILFVIFLSISAMAENSVRSVGSGPEFEVAPAIVFANGNGEFQIGVFSEDGSPVNFEAYFNDEIQKTFDKQWTFQFKLPEGKMYSYITFESHKGPLTSLATALILSSNLAIKIDKGIGFTFFPSYNGYMKGDEEVFSIVGPGYGHENLKFSIDKKVLYDMNLSTVSNFPKVFESSLDTSELADGFHNFSISSNLITGQALQVDKTIGIDNTPPKVLSSNGQELFFEGKFVITIQATDTMKLTDAYFYRKSSNGSLTFIGESGFVNGRSALKINDFSGSQTFVAKIFDVSNNVSVYEFTLVNNKPFLIPLIILLTTFGIILLTLLR